MKQEQLDILGDNAKDIIDWFSEHYLLSKEMCFSILFEAQKKYPFTIDELKEGCQLLRQHDSECLTSHIEAIGLMCYRGISAYKAGQALSKILIKQEIHNGR